MALSTAWHPAELLVLLQLELTHPNRLVLGAAPSGPPKTSSVLRAALGSVFPNSKACL